MNSVITLAELGLLPDSLIRSGIRRLLRQRLAEVSANEGDSAERLLAEQLRNGPLAIATHEANAQHYEVSAEFFQRVLGPRLKYSCCYFDHPNRTLAEAEASMLDLTCRRAEIEDGMRILELGCGWGSLSLWLAEQYPHSRITALSNSNSQRDFIQAQAHNRGLRNLEIITDDMRNFSTPESFDRVVSVEMFEHIRNYEMLFRRIASWLHTDGKLFAHVFCHRTTPYLFETEGSGNWMGRHFFTGGTMPSENLFRRFPHHLQVEQQWQVNGLQYWRTCEAWLANLDRYREQLVDCFSGNTTRRSAQRYLQRWRMFFMACAELFRYREGSEWFVAHFLFGKTPARISPRVSSEQLHSTSF